jgi:hypothetical protein
VFVCLCAVVVVAFANDAIWFDIIYCLFVPGQAIHDSAQRRASAQAGQLELR